ncbi:hypothetical protein ACTMTJ_34690 [Phytohabitans sp. LJ34]|uniref:hypothetical protein n=1 Tax=Phytohabitans sp. LJ34 TaxID=3452217 RepID=UPI003F895874
MNRDDAAWLEHLDIITAWGRASAINGSPPATDDELWTISRRRQDLNLPEHLDAGLLPRLRDAFNKGRFAGRIDLRALADALRERGHDAVVERTDGGVVLYGGRQAPDRDGVPRWSAVVRPGWYQTRDLRHAVADLADCRIGPDGENAWAVTVPHTWTIDPLVQLTIAVIDEVETRRARFARAAQDALDAIWTALAAAHQAFTTSDAAPGADHPFAAESTKLLAGWLADNWPDARTVPAHIAAFAAGGRNRNDDQPPDEHPHDYGDYSDVQ